MQRSRCWTETERWLCVLRGLSNPTCCVWRSDFPESQVINTVSKLLTRLGLPPSALGPRGSPDPGAVTCECCPHTHNPAKQVLPVSCQWGSRNSETQLTYPKTHVQNWGWRSVFCHHDMLLFHWKSHITQFISVTFLSLLLQSQVFWIFLSF